MIDRNKLNRIKGVLSAKEGTEIPKFLNPALPINKTFYKKDGKYFLDGNEVTLELYYKDPRVLTESTKIISPNPLNTPTIIQTPKIAETVPTKIIGAPVVTPTTAVEDAAKILELKKANTDDIAATYNLPEVEITAPKSKSINDGLKIDPVPLTIPEKLEVPAALLEEQESAGMKFREAKKLEKLERIGKIAGTAALIGTEIFKGVGDAFGAQQAATDSNLTKGADAIYDTAAGVVKNLGPVGQVIGTAMENAAIAGDIIQGLGGGTDQMTTMDKWMDSSFFSWNIGMLNGFGGKKADSFAADRDILASIGSSYGGTTEDINNAAAKASKKYGLFSSSARRKANRLIADARAKLNLMGNISEEAADLRLAALSMGEQAGLAYSLITDGGYNLKYTYAAKQGGLLEWNPIIELKWEPRIELNWELPEFKEGGSIEELEWIPEFKEGGKTEKFDIPEIEETTQKNVIPEGALHKNKHHMEHAEGLTKKGIPVIDEDGELLAEIEHSEIIFTLEVTKKLEEYYDIFYSEESSNKEKEQAALDAGKLLVYQILENTDDRTGLIESCKKGGTIQLKKSTDDLIEEVLEWMPTIVVIEEEVKEEKPKEDNKKSEKELMKEAIKEVLIELLTK